MTSAVSSLSIDGPRPKNHKFGAKLTNSGSEKKHKIRSKKQSSYAKSALESNFPPDSLAFSILEELRSRQYECLVCIGSVTKGSKVWSCDNCFRVFHLACIGKWARQGMNSGSSAQEPKVWRCPGCQQGRSIIPLEYDCWCGKVRDPAVNPTVPHSCGQTCGYEYEDCPHFCQLQCHPGTHQKCSAMGPPQSCFCGKNTCQNTCQLTKYEGWSCNTVCEEIMPCGKHTCKRACHSDLCGPCMEQIEVTCYCGKHKEFRSCSELLETKQSITQAENGSINVWEGKFECNEKCGREYDCGIHKCDRSCHSYGLQPSICPMSPKVITKCHCGKKSIKDILGKDRESCTEPIPNCGQACAKILPCGHTCQKECHTGECPPCREERTARCRCGRSEFIIECGSEMEPECERICHTQLSCGRHECMIKCCPSEPIAYQRLASRKKPKSAARGDDWIEPEHVCTKKCDRLLSCGNHRCQETCHRGPCNRCLEASFEELSCYCGKTIIQPPIACGTAPPTCKFSCTRQPSCGHPPIPHLCHSDDNCPKCAYLVERPCICGKKMLKNQQCGRPTGNCGTPCNKLLSCGSHKCQKICHPKGECEKCTQPCHKLRSCGHPDLLPCHAPFKCKEIEPCKTLVKVTCACGHLSAMTPCGICDSNKSGPQPLTCTNACAKAERSRKLAEAFNIDLNARQAKIDSETSVYPDDAMRFYISNREWCETIEMQVLDAFVHTDTPEARLAFPPMRSSQRKFIHELASSFGLDSVAQDPEPHRSVTLYYKKASFVPASKSLRDYFPFYKNPNRSQLSRMSSSNDGKDILSGTIKRYNGFLLQNVRDDLSIASIEADIRVLLGWAPSSYMIRDIDSPSTRKIGIRFLIPNDETELDTKIKTYSDLVRSFVDSNAIAEQVVICSISDNWELNFIEPWKAGRRKLNTLSSSEATRDSFEKDGLAEPVNPFSILDGA